MRILHTSDWHLGQNFMTKSRLEEHRAFLSWLLELIEKREIELLLVSGDIFDTGTPPNYALELYYNFLKELSYIASLKTTIITAGNHDSIATIKAPKQLLELLNVYVVASGDERVVIPIEDDGKTKAIVCAVPFLRDSVIRDSLEGETISQKEKEANRGIKNYYERVHKEALELQKSRDIPIIAMGHLTTVGSRTSQSERDIYIGGTLDIGGEYLASMFDYVALGHLHINQVVGSKHVRYSGSPIALSFSESKNTQKVNIVTFNAKDIEIEEVEVPRVRELLVLRGDLKSIESALKSIEDRSTWIEIHIEDDNPIYASIEIRELAAELDLTVLALKVDKTQKQLEAKEFKAISLDELSAKDLFRKRLELEEIEDEELYHQLLDSFSKIATKVEQL